MVGGEKGLGLTDPEHYMLLKLSEAVRLLLNSVKGASIHEQSEMRRLDSDISVLRRELLGEYIRQTNERNTVAERREETSASKTGDSVNQ